MSTNITDRLTDESCQYVLDDCLQAIKVNPLNPKTEHYLKCVRECSEALFQRERKRALRKLQNAVTDQLAYRASLDIVSRRALIARSPVLYPWLFGTMRIKHAKEAALSLALIKKFS